MPPLQPTPPDRVSPYPVNGYYQQYRECGRAGIVRSLTAIPACSELVNHRPRDGLMGRRMRPDSDGVRSAKEPCFKVFGGCRGPVSKTGPCLGCFGVVDRSSSGLVPGFNRHEVPDRVLDPARRRVLLRHERAEVGPVRPLVDRESTRRPRGWRRTPGGAPGCPPLPPSSRPGTWP
jgi:hypothetical protein